ncbi:methyltransferase, FkbM family [Alteromonadaceae bacterium Bs31]|nr:methyltransferase, FkbM family [Alteromonadaceae bacterium Bs31]
MTEILKRNLSKNTQGVQLFECAAGASDGEGELELPRDSADNIGMATIKLGSSSNAIKVRPLDAIIRDWQETLEKPMNIGLIKVDVEGMELDVLKGARSIIEKYKPSLFLEAASQLQFRVLERFLSDFGYKALGFWAHTPVYHFEHKPSFLLQCRATLRKLRPRL